jgi:hypothetical protein
MTSLVTPEFREDQGLGEIHLVVRVRLVTLTPTKVGRVVLKIFLVVPILLIFLSGGEKDSVPAQD